MWRSPTVKSRPSVREYRPTVQLPGSTHRVSTSRGAVEQNLSDTDAQRTAEAARKHSDVVVGFKLAHFEGRDWTPTERTVEAGRLANVPVMIDFGRAEPPLSLETPFSIIYVRATFSRTPMATCRAASQSSRMASCAHSCSRRRSVGSCSTWGTAVRAMRTPSPSRRRALEDEGVWRRVQD